MKYLSVLFFSWAILCAQPRVLKVGAGQEFPTLANLPILVAGDTVEISPGVYFEAKRFIASNPAEQPITIKGVGGKPIFDGRNIKFDQPRALFQFEGGSWIVEDIEFRYCHNYDANASGDRIISGSVILRRVKVWNCDMGVMSSDPTTLVQIEDSSIRYNGRSSLSHNLYLGGQQVILRRNEVSHSFAGQNVKLRSRISEVTDNYIHDSRDGELEFVESQWTAAAGADAKVERNVITSMAERNGGNCCRFVNFGNSGAASPYDRVGTIYSSNNTFIAQNPLIQFLTLASLNSKIVSKGDSFIGSLNLTRDRYGAGADAISVTDFRHLKMAAKLDGLRKPQAAPTFVTAKLVAGPKVELRWKAVPYATEYRIYIQRPSKEGVPGRNLMYGAATEVFFIDLGQFITGLNLTYNYQITAVDVQGSETAKSVVTSIVVP